MLDLRDVESGGFEELSFKCNICGGMQREFSGVYRVSAEDFVWLGVHLSNRARLVKDSIGRDHYICGDCVKS